MPRSRRQPQPVVQVTVTVTDAVPLRCATCAAPATVIMDVDGTPLGAEGARLYLCDACYLAWQQSTPGHEGERLTELRG